MGLRGEWELLWDGVLLATVTFEETKKNILHLKFPHWIHNGECHIVSSSIMATHFFKTKVMQKKVTTSLFFLLSFIQEKGRLQCHVGASPSDTNVHCRLSLFLTFGLPRKRCWFYLKAANCPSEVLHFCHIALTGRQVEKKKKNDYTNISCSSHKILNTVSDVK